MATDDRSNGRRPVGRFAPSPTGRLHAGNLFAALVSWAIVRRSSGRMVLRIEDLDPDRSKPRYADAIMNDYAWLGLSWDEGPLFQHDRCDAYAAAFESLRDRGLLYPCYCTRADLHAASAPHAGEKYVYAGTCRRLTESQRAAKALHRNPAWRLTVPDETIEFADAFQGRFSQNLLRECGDFIVQRSDGAFAYQLAVVLDDGEQGITSIVRGLDLLDSTPQQLYVQRLFGYAAPDYAHIPLVVNEEGKRLSKRDHAAGIDALKERFKTPEALIGHLAALSGVMPDSAPLTAEEFAKEADFSALVGRDRIVWS